MTTGIHVNACGHPYPVWQQRVEYVRRDGKERMATIGVQWMCVMCARESSIRVRNGHGQLVKAVEDLVAYFKDPVPERWQTLRATMEPFLREQGELF